MPAQGRSRNSPGLPSLSSPLIKILKASISLWNPLVLLIGYFLLFILVPRCYLIILYGTFTLVLKLVLYLGFYTVILIQSSLLMTSLEVGLSNFLTLCWISKISSFVLASISIFMNSILLGVTIVMGLIVSLLGLIEC